MLSKFISKELRDAMGVASVMGYHLATAPLVGYGMGWYLDKYFGTKPWLTYIFLVLGIVAGFRMVFQDVRKLNKIQEEEDRKSKGQDD